MSNWWESAPIVENVSAVGPPAAGGGGGKWWESAPVVESDSQSTTVPKQDVDLATRAGMAGNRSAAAMLSAPQDAMRWASRGLTQAVGLKPWPASPSSSESYKSGVAELGKAASSVLPGVFSGNSHPDSAKPAETMAEKIAEAVGHGVVEGGAIGGAAGVFARSMAGVDSFASMALNMLRGTSATSNAAMNAGGAAAGVVAEEKLAPAENPTVLGQQLPLRELIRAGAEVLGGGGVAAAETGTRALARPVTRPIGNAMAAPFRNAEESAVREALKHVDIERQADFRTSLANADGLPPQNMRPEGPLGADRFGDEPALARNRPPDETTGNLTLFQATGDTAPRLGELERTAMTKNPAAAMEVRQEQNAARLDAMRGQFDQNADTGSVGQFLRTQLDNIEAEYGTAVAKARQEAQARLGESGGTQFDNAADYGGGLQRQLDTLDRQRKAAEDRLWENFREAAGDKPIDFREFRKAVAEIEGNIGPMAKRPKGEEAEILSTIRAAGDFATFRDIGDLRSQITDALRNPQDLTGTQRRRLSEVLGRLDATLDTEVARVAQDSAALAPKDTQWTIIKRPGTNPNNGLEIPVAINPTRDDVARLSSESQFREVRIIRDETGNVYAWPAELGTHHGVAQALDVRLPTGVTGEGLLIKSKGGRFTNPKEELEGWFREPAAPAAGLTPDDVAAYDVARTATRERKQTFGEGAVGAVLEPGPRRGTFNTTESLVPGRLLKRPEDLRAFVAAAGDNPEAMALAQDALAFDMRKKAMKDGILSPQRLQEWTRDNAEALRQFPDLAAKFSNARAAQGALDDAIANQKASLEGYQTAAVKNFIADQDQHAALEKAMKTPASFDALVSEIKTDQAALAGLKRLAVETIMRKGKVAMEEGTFVGAKEAGTSGNPQIAAANAMQNFFINQRPAFAKIFDKDEMANISAVMENIQKGARSEGGVRIPGQSNTAQDAWGIFKSGMSDVYRKAGSILGTTGGVYAAMADPFIGAPIAAGGIALDAWRTAYRGRMDAALADIMLDARKAQIAIPKVIAKAEAKDQAIRDATVARKLRALLGQEVIRDLEALQE